MSTQAASRSQQLASKAIPVLITGCAVLGLGACSTSTGTKSGAASPQAAGSASATTTAQSAVTTPPAVPQNGLAKGLSLPLSAYMETYPESRTIDGAVKHLEHDCMGRFGFTFDPPASTGSPAPSYDDTNMARRYGITDRDQAGKFGYGLGDESFTPPPAPKMNAAEIAVFSGHVAMKPGAAEVSTASNGMTIPKDGCQGEAVSKVGGRIDTTLPARLSDESLNRAQAEPAVQAALHQWSTCMAAKGYNVDLPYNAANLAPRSGSQGPSSTEITIALADIDCKEKADLVGIWFKADTEIQKELVEKNQLALTDVRNHISDAVKAATAVVGP